MHKRQQVRMALAAALAGVSAPVHVSRVYDYRRDELPAISLYTPSEQIDDAKTVMLGTGCRLYRELECVIEIRTRLTDTFEDDADTLASEVEEAVDAAEDLGGLIVQAQLTSTAVEISGDDKPTCLLTLRFQIDYQTTT